MSKNIKNYFIELFKPFRPHSKSLKELDIYDTNIKNEKNEIIIFNVYLEVNEYDEQYLHIVFGRNTNIEATCHYLKSHHSKDIMKLTNFIIYYFRAERTTERDKVIIKEVLQPKKEYQIEELIKRVSRIVSPEIFDREPFIKPSAFVFPKINYFNKRIDTVSQKPQINDNYSIIFNSFNSFKNDFLNDWFKNDNSSILVIKGKGGIGKTTMAKYFANYLLKSNEHTSKVFINSLDAKSFLLNEFHNNRSIKIDLYQLYKATQKGENTLSDLFFKKNLDAGNFFIIIDGIDELISKVKNFDITEFLISIKNYSSIINNAKIIITCRTYFWNLDDSSKYNIESLEIKPFTFKQTESFFNQSFNNDEKKVENALSLAKDFHKKEDKLINNDNYHPYALDIISKIIKSNKI